VTRPDDLRRVADEIGDLGGDDVSAAVRTAEESFGGPDAAFNNAGDAGLFE